jgi:hypothetical protein
MTLAAIYKVFGGFHILMGVMMGLTLLGTIPDGEGWGMEGLDGIVTMAEHFGSALVVIGFMFWMLPSWTSEAQLKKATMPLIGAQVLLVLVPLYHAYVSKTINADGGFYGLILISLVLIGLFYSRSR